jgi:protein-S-isoprenylcysteine O-methyltransferase Ste14
MSEAPEAKALPPPSVTHFGLCCLVLVCSMAALFALHESTLELADKVLLMCASVAIPMILLDVVGLRVHKRVSTGLDWSKKFSPSPARIVIKLLGLAVTLAPFVIAYWAFHYYKDGFFDPFYALLGRAWPFLAVLTPIYIGVVDGLMAEPQDPYWQLGRLVLGHPGDLRGSEIANHYRGWLVKAFFFPFMFVWLTDSTRSLMGFDLSTVSRTNLPFDAGRDLVYFVDLLFCTVGYAMSLRPLDSHIRSAEPTMLGWAVALFCYPPFYERLFEREYTPYQATNFSKWLVGHPSLTSMFGFSIFVLIVVYSLATVAFGLRFSNLTHRGILTNGPYRWSKHPAYITKNLSWWLTAVPFVVTDGHPWNSVKRCLMLLVVNFIYFLRARTEERHLSRDPTYVAYALWMNEHGMLKFLNRIPGLRYVPPTPSPAPAATETPAAAEEDAAEAQAHAE